MPGDATTVYRVLDIQQKKRKNDEEADGRAVQRSGWVAVVKAIRWRMVNGRSNMR